MIGTKDEDTINLNAENQPKWLVFNVVDYPFQLSNLVRGLEVLLEGFIGTG